MHQKKNIIESRFISVFLRAAPSTIEVTATSMKLVIFNTMRLRELDLHDKFEM